MSSQLRVVSVNVGLPRELRGARQVLQSAIDKRPVAGECFIGPTGLTGDGRAEARRCGDADHAVCVYPHSHYAHWARALELSGFPMGQFGENLTVTGPYESQVRIGDILRYGKAVLQVAHPRIPCRKLDIRMGQPFAKRFLRSRRVGYYMRVLEPGPVAAGDPIECLDIDPSSPTIDEFVRIAVFDYWDELALERLSRARGLPDAWQQTLREKLQRARDADRWCGQRELVVVARGEDAEGESWIELGCAQGGTLPDPGDGCLVALVWRRAEGARAIRVLAPAHTAPTRPGSYRVMLRPTGTMGEPADVLHDALRVGEHVRAEAPRGQGSRQ